MHSVTRLARLSMADTVWKHHEVPCRVEQLSRSEQLSAEGPAREAAAGARRPVQHDHCVPHDACCVAPRFAERDVVHAELGERLAALELEVANDVVGPRKGLSRRGARDGEEAQKGKTAGHGRSRIEEDASDDSHSPNSSTAQPPEGLGGCLYAAPATSVGDCCCVAQVSADKYSGGRSTVETPSDVA